MADPETKSESFTNRFLEIVLTVTAAAGFSFLNAQSNPYATAGLFLCATIAAILRIERVRNRLHQRFRGQVTSIATSAWSWFGICGLLLIYAAVMTFTVQYKGTRFLQNEIRLIRDDLNTYVLPRRLTTEQIALIAAYLAKFKPFEISFEVLKNNNEAGQLRVDLQKALEQGGWKISGFEYPLDLPEGLHLHFKQTLQTQQSKPDLKNPSRTVYLLRHSGMQGSASMVALAAKVEKQLSRIL